MTSRRKRRVGGPRAPAPSGSVKISDADIARLQREGAEGVRFYETVGLREVRSRAAHLVLTGAVCIVGLLGLGWSPMAMLVYLVADAVITVLADIVRFLLARPWVAASHRRDHDAGRLLLIADGLEDGTAARADTGQAPKPGLLLFFGVASTIFLLPVIGAASEKIGIGRFLDVTREPYFNLMVGLDAAWRVLSALWQSIRVRRTEPGEELIVMESGSVAVLYAGLLVLVWLPLKWGQPGLLALFFLLYLVRLAFGLFALIWTPRAVKNLKRRVLEGDYSVTVKA